MYQRFGCPECACGMWLNSKRLVTPLASFTCSMSLNSCQSLSLTSASISRETPHRQQQKRHFLKDPTYASAQPFGTLHNNGGEGKALIHARSYLYACAHASAQATAECTFASP